MATPATIWSNDGGSGAEDGTSLANAYDLPDGVTAINALGALSQDLTHRICADSAITLAAALQLTKDATVAYRINHQGRNAADTADTLVELDANDGAFPVWDLVNADMHRFLDLHATNTDENAGNDGWAIAANADGIEFVRCEASHCFRGFDGSAAVGIGYHRCFAHDNADTGFYANTAYSGGALCKSKDNSGHGFFEGNWTLSIADGNNIGFLRPLRQVVRCVAFNNSSHGFYGSHGGSYVCAPLLAIACAATENAYGFYTDAANYAIHLVKCASYGNSSGRIDTTGFYRDVDPIVCASDPFVDAANGDFRPNKVADGGLLLENLDFAHLDELFNLYLTGGGGSRFNAGPRALSLGGIR